MAVVGCVPSYSATWIQFLWMLSFSITVGHDPPHSLGWSSSFPLTAKNMNVSVAFFVRAVLVLYGLVKLFPRVIVYAVLPLFTLSIYTCQSFISDGTFSSKSDVGVSSQLSASSTSPFTIESVLKLKSTYFMSASPGHVPSHRLNISAFSYCRFFHGSH